MKKAEIPSYAAALEFLRDLQVFGANFGLETPHKLAALAGNPQNQLRFIHVAGTNGKGSVCAMLESVYRAAGLRVGLFTSPHLVSFRERIQINRQFIPESEVARLVAEIQESLKIFSVEQHPTFFEVVTVLALKFFAEHKCDLVIWETGLGGRLDATNIVTPLVSVITNIALDHQQWLGDSLEKIAAEKAGIIKPGVPVIMAAEAEAFAVIERTANSLHAPLTRVESALTSILHPPYALALLGEHQQLNAALALATVDILQQHISVGDSQLRDGLAHVNWPGRLQLIECGGQQFLLDGAHNIAGAEALRAALRQLFPAAKPTLILGVLGDKDWSPMCAILAPLAARILAVPVNSPRSAAAAALAEACRTANPAAEVATADSLKTALTRAGADELVVIAGSLYLVGEALALLDPTFADGDDERGLNDWTASSTQTSR
jgi:dihydrofolate synthase/folylpolyglutamate synthase